MSPKKSPSAPQSTVTPALTLTMASDQVVAVHMSEPAHLQVLTAMAVEQRRLEVLANLLTRTYHMGTQPTPGLGYDDRLTTRLKCGHNMAYNYLSLPVAEGGLRHRRMGKKYVVTEEAVRDFFGDTKINA
jgi:hypothetical protein